MDLKIILQCEAAEQAVKEAAGIHENQTANQAANQADDGAAATLAIPDDTAVTPPHSDRCNYRPAIPRGY